MTSLSSPSELQFALNVFTQRGNATRCQTALWQGGHVIESDSGSFVVSCTSYVTAIIVTGASVTN